VHWPTAWGGVSGLSNRLDRSQSQLSQLIGKSPSKVIEKRLARYIEQRVKRPSGWLDKVHVVDWLAISREDWRAALRRDLLRYGITVDADLSSNEKSELELLTCFRLLDETDQIRLLKICQTFVDPG